MLTAMDGLACVGILYRPASGVVWIDSVRHVSICQSAKNGVQRICIVSRGQCTQVKDNAGCVAV